MSEKSEGGIARRDFFRISGLGAGAAVAAAIVAKPEEAQAMHDVGGVSKAGYRETESVKTYYELARF